MGTRGRNKTWRALDGEGALEEDAGCQRAGADQRNQREGVGGALVEQTG